MKAATFARQGAVGRRTIEPRGEWFGELCAWLRRPVADVGAIGWPMLLVPEKIDEDLAAPAETLQVYHRVSWTAPVPRTPLALEARPVWVSGRGEWAEVGLASSARADGSLLAESLMVVRSHDGLESWGERERHERPEDAPTRRRLSFSVTEPDVATFARLAGTHYPVHDDVQYAWKLGYPNVLVQGLALMLIVMHAATVGDRGTAEMWFLAPVPAGSLLTLWQGVDGGDEVWALRSTGQNQLAAVARITPGD
jgi:acyl dehydratase